MELSYPERHVYFDGVMAQLFGLGLDSATLTAEDCWGAIHPDDVAPVSVVIDACERGSPGYELEYRVIWPNGDTRYIRSLGTLVVDAAGAPAKIVGTSWDVTEMRNLTAQLAAEKERAERANHAKSNFLAVMSHEIRTPMNGVMGMNALLLGTTLTPAQRRMADAVQYSADALLTIIDDILDFSKLEAGRVDLESIDFDLAELIDKVAEVMAPKATAKHLTLSIERTFSGPCWFRGDPARLRQILLNLVSNAVKFTEVGRIVISASALPRDIRTSRLWFEVRDTGIGIADDAKRRLFQPFEQADATITRRFGGTGLGLSICKRLVEQMGGMIGVMDHARGGSVFWFEIPLPAVAPRSAEDAVAEHHPAAAATPATGHILLAEDNAMNVKLAACS
jgi:signal transduction histidine kinase